MRKTSLYIHFACMLFFLLDWMSAISPFWYHYVLTNFVTPHEMNVTVYMKIPYM